VSRVFNEDLPAVVAYEDDAGLFHLVVRAQTLFKREARKRTLAVLGIPYSQAVTLSHLARDSRLSCQQLAQLIGCDASHITRLIQGLERGRLVESRRGDSDRRTLQLRLTAYGEAVARRVPAVLREVDQWALKPLTNLEQEHLAEILTRFNGAEDTIST